jgi:hypothetical protein|tara:strand:+ start:197 stop:460 length:264 start_codon:yes stop_codon:yes gene_type:complete
VASKKEIELMKKIVEEEALDCYLDHEAEYEFEEFNNEVETLYVWQLQGTKNPVEYEMLTGLVRRIAKIDPRYRVGIVLEDMSTSAED